jgi:FkbM family methyltransferase
MKLVARAAALVPRPLIRAVSHARWRWRWLSGVLDRVANQLREQDSVIQRGVGKGLKFNAGPSNAGYILGTTEPVVQDALKRYLKPGMTVWDAGANVGFFSMLAARLVGPGGRVVCLEPLSKNAKRVEYNAALNGFGHVIVRREALGRRDGRAPFVVAPESTMGMLSESNFLKPDQRVVGEVEVPLRTIDSLVAEGVPRPDLIKLDIEGTEADALAGGAETLRVVRPVLLVELHGTNQAVAEVLGRLGYHGAVIGSDRPIPEAAWNGYVVAVPADLEDLVRDVDSFCKVAAEIR